MGPIEIPIATPLGKVGVIGCCALIVMVVLWWGVPKFKGFLDTAFGRTLRKPETKNIHIVLGFAVYAIIFAPAAVATLIGAGIATTAPTLVSSTGVMGSNFACEVASSLVFSCSSPLGFGNRRKTILWTEIDRVDCISRGDGTIGALYIHSRTRQIEIGSLAVHDLSGVRKVILAHAPQSAARPCDGAFD